MSDQRLRDLLHEVADGIEPGDRLEAIRVATAGGGRRTGRGWWAAGGAALVAASVVTAFALTTGGGPRGSEPGPAEPPPTRTTATEDPQTRTVPIYFVGDTPDGPRLFREFQGSAGTWAASPEKFALEAALRGNALDDDYRSDWPDGAHIDSIGLEPDLVTISLDGDIHDRPPGMTEAEAQLAIEQVVRTAQGVFGQGRVPVRLLLNDQITDQVLGVPASEPLTVGSDLAVLAHVSISDPSEGTEVDNDEPFTVRGRGNSFEGNIVTRIQRWEGTAVVAEEPAIAGTYEDKLFPFEVTFDLSQVPPGVYVVSSRTDDPTGEGRFHTDTRRITIID